MQSSQAAEEQTVPMTHWPHLTEGQLKAIEDYVFSHGRTLEKAKWKCMTQKGSPDELLSALLAYQNEDGGFGNGLEADIRMPDSSSIASAEALMLALEYGLSKEEPWFKALLNYFEKTVDLTGRVLSYWEKVPPHVEAYPHAPWWHYEMETLFSPNPCAVVAAAFIVHGSESQKILGETIAQRCLAFLKGNDLCTEHDCYCLEFMVEVLIRENHALVDDDALKALNRRVEACLCTDSSKWQTYVAQPFDLAASPRSKWYECIRPYAESNAAYWVATLRAEGFWEPNFSWGVDSPLSQEVTEIWRSHMAVKRVKILKAYEAYHRLDGVFIEPATSEDFEAVSEFFELILKDTFLKNQIWDLQELLHEEIIEKNKFLSEALSASGTDRFFLIAKLGEKIVGTIAIGPANVSILEGSKGYCKDWLEIGSVFVHPDYQGMGLGAKLLHRMEIHLSHLGIDHYCLDSGYPEAQKTWTKKLGEPTYLLKDYWAEGADHMIWIVEKF